MAWGVQAYFIKLANASMDAASIFFYMTVSGLLLVPVALAMTDFSQPINYAIDGPGLAAAIQVLNSIGAPHAGLRLPVWQGDHRIAAHQRRRAVDRDPGDDPGLRDSGADQAGGNRARAAGRTAARAAASTTRRSSPTPARQRAGSRILRMTPLVELVARHKSGQPAGIYSLVLGASAVIESALHEARACGTPLLIEATSNQVNQFGGYTGLTPAGFRAFVHDIAGRVGYPADRVWFGGDHLGPNVWRQEAAATAMRRAEELVAQFVAAGFRKLHLDCSMSCADDPSPLPEVTVASRAARLCAAASAPGAHGGDAPAYVIGTEVPAPGGAGEDLLALTVTTPEAAQATIEAHRGAFEAADLAAAWPRAGRAGRPARRRVRSPQGDRLSAQEGARAGAYIARTPQFVYEAHSTDYQTPENLQALVRDHFAILKVGPAATLLCARRSGHWPRSNANCRVPPRDQACAR